MTMHATQMTRLGPVPGQTLLRWAGRILLLAWSGFWSWFNVASLLGEVAELGIGAWINHGLLAAVIVGTTILGLVRPRIGGALLLLLAAGLAIFFHGVTPFVGAILILPPACAGVLLLLTTPRPA